MLAFCSLFGFGIRVSYCLSADSVDCFVGSFASSFVNVGGVFFKRIDGSVRFDSPEIYRCPASLRVRI